MKCVTIHQPYADAVCEGVKSVENRMWKTSYRGALLIHAGKKSRAWIDAARESGAFGEEFPDEEDLTFGAVVGVVDVVDCLKYPQDMDQLDFDTAKLRDDPFAAGPYCWIFENPRRFAAPIEALGRQRLFDFPLKEADIPCLLAKSHAETS